MIVGTVVSALLVAAAGELVDGDHGAHAADRRALVAAHRGGAALAPENSLTAFRNAIGLGVDFLEFDLHQTSEGEIVVIHDPTLERTTTGQGPVSALVLGDLASLRLRARDGAATEDPIPTLAQVLDLVAPSAVQVMPEIKVGADRRRYDRIEAGVIAMLRARGLSERATVQSFDWPTLRRLHDLAPGLRTMLLVSAAIVERRGAVAAEAVRWARDLGATDLGIDYRLLDAAVVAAARRANIRVVVWTVNDEPDMKRAIETGADVIISDRPDRALRLSGR